MAQIGNSQGDMWGLLIMIGVFFLIMYLMIIRPQSKRAKEHKKLIDSISKGDEVVTNGGLLGRVIAVGETFAHIELAEGIEVKVQKQSITNLMPKGTIKSAD